MRYLVPIALLAAAPPAIAAPTIEAIYVQGRVLDGADSIPGFIPPGGTIFDPIDGDIVRRLGQRIVHALPNGNFFGVVNTNPQVFGFGNFPSANSAGAGAEYLFGSDDRGQTPKALLRESTINNASTGGVDQTQRDLGSTGGIDYNGDFSYSAGVPDPRPNRSQFQIPSLWENENLVYLEGDAVPAGPNAGLFFESASSVYRSPAGETRWTASLTDTSFGDTVVKTVLFRDTTTFDVVLESGDVIPGLGAVEVGGISNLEWSLGGGHYIAEIDVAPGFTDDEAITVSGTALQTRSGGLVREGELIPAADGGLPGEVWTGFQRIDVNESGDAIFGGFTSGPDGMDNVIVVDGVIRYREGEVLDGVTLSGLPQGVGINDRGDIAIVWSDNVFINDVSIASAGAAVDTDGDGVTDATIDDEIFSGGQFEITNLPAAGGDGLPVVYFSADVTDEGDAYFRLAAADTSAGDYNGDGVVDAADYTVWRDSLGSEVLLAADGDGDNVVDQDDYAIWAANFGSAAATSVPEPTTLLLIIGVAALSAARTGRA